MIKTTFELLVNMLRSLRGAGVYHTRPVAVAVHGLRRSDRRCIRI